MSKDRVEEYLGKRDWRIQENANSNYCYQSLISHVAGAAIAEHTLENVYPKEIADLHRDGSMHIHDLSNGIVPYCAGWSFMDILLKGFEGGPGRLRSAPAKHLDSILAQLMNFLITLQGEWAGAQAINSFDTFLAPFVRADNLTYEQVRQDIQRFVFMLNTGMRLGQASFTNVTLDWNCPKDLKDTPVIIGGEPHDEWTYGDFPEEMAMINRAFLEVMLEGDADGRIFSFPIPTYSMTPDFDWKDENARLLFLATGKYGLPYFQNFISSDRDPSEVRSMCCRLQLSLMDLRHKGGGLFGSGDKTGSIGVVTLNLPRIGYLAKDKEDFRARLGSLLDSAMQALELKRGEVSKNFENGLMPYSKIYLGTLDNHFHTIGTIGMHEMCMNFLGKGIETEEGRAFALEVLEMIRERLQEFQEKTGHLYNLEGVPGEGTSYRLAKEDRDRYPEMYTSGTEVPYYTNSSQLPVGYTDDLFEALRHQDELQCAYTGGTVFHAYIGEQVEDPETVGNLVRKVFEHFRMPYFSLTPTFSICPVHGYIPGDHETCPYDT